MEDDLKMKVTLSAAAFAVMMIVSSGVARADDPAAQPADPFTITLPDGYGEFTTQVQTAKSPEGEIVTTNWISKAPSGEAVVVTMSVMPAKILDPQKLISSTSASLLKSLGATIDSEEARAQDAGSAGLLFHSDAAFFRSRFTVQEDRFFQLLYVGRSMEQRTAPSVGQIFESFRIADSNSHPQS